MSASDRQLNWSKLVNTGQMIKASS